MQLDAKMKFKVAMARHAVGTRETARQALDCFDLTSLTGQETDRDIFDLCDIAKNNRLASVCIYPAYVATAKKAIRDDALVIAAVINFPHGHKRTMRDDPATAETTAEDTARAVAAGARQIDIVLAHDDFRARRRHYVTDMLRACRHACGEGVTMKVILETASFKKADELRAACQLAIRAGADCLKTSTGKHPGGGATLEAASVLLDEAHRAFRPVGVKISGGIRTVDDCARYMTLARSVAEWNIVRPDSFRIGASSLLGPLLDTLKPAASAPVLLADYALS